MKHSWILFLTGLLALGGSARAASTLYAATSIGPFKSTDSGVTWKQIILTSTDPALPGIPRLQAIAVDPQTPSTLYAMARFDGPTGVLIAIAFLKSTDSAATWSVVSKPTFPVTDSEGLLAIDPVKTNVLYAMNANSGLEVTTDGGVTWTEPTIPKPAGAGVGGTANQPRLAGVAADPNHSGVVYVIGSTASFHPGKGYLLKSTDFGNTWSLLTSTAGFGGRIFINPKNSQEIYGTTPDVIVGCTDTSGGQCGIYKSIDGGQSWTELNIPAAVVQNVAIDITPGLLYASAHDLGSTNVYTSADGGNTWKTVFPDVVNIGDIVRADPNAAMTAYAVGPSDVNIVSRTTDGGVTWKGVALLGCGSLTQVICGNGAYIYGLVVAPQAANPQSPPVISANGVVNGASFQPGIVANSWMSILGSNLATGTDNWNNSIVNGKLPTSLDGVSVTVGGKPAYVYVITPGQLNVLAPDITAGPITVTVTTPGGSVSATTTASVYGPAFFLWPGNQAVATRQDFSFAVKAGTFAGATTVAAKPGDVLILWATGFGPTSPAVTPGVAVPGDRTYATATLPSVTINNTSATVFGAALAPGSVGLYQIAIQVPATLADGDWPIQANVGGVQSPTGTVLSVHQ